MHPLDHLQKISLLMRMGDLPWTAAVDWAVERLLRNEEAGELDIVMLAAAIDRDDAEALTEAVLTRHCGTAEVRDEMAAACVVLDLHRAYVAGQLTLQALDRALWRLTLHVREVAWLEALAIGTESVLIHVDERAIFDRRFDEHVRVWQDCADLDRLLRGSPLANGGVPRALPPGSDRRRSSGGGAAH